MLLFNELFSYRLTHIYEYIYILYMVLNEHFYAYSFFSPLNYIFLG